MNVFENVDLVDRYEAFARCFTIVRTDDFSTQADVIYRNSKFRDKPSIGINLQFEQRTRRLDTAADDGRTGQGLERSR